MKASLGVVFRAAASNFALVCGSVMFCLVVLEVALRLVDGVPVLSATNFLAQRLDIIRTNAGPLAYDPLIGWKLSSYYAPPISASAITIAEDGIRMNSSEVRPVPRNATVAVGSTMTFGTGVPNGQTWPAQLEAKLGEPVVNAAAEGWGMDQIVLRAEELTGKFAPKTLIIAIADRDVPLNLLSVYRGAYKPYFTVEDGKLVLQKPQMRLSGECTQPTGQNGSVVLGLLLQRLAALEKSGTRVVVLLLYGKDTLRSGARPGHMSVISGQGREMGLQVVDTFDEMLKRFDGGTNLSRVWGEPPEDELPCSTRPRTWLAASGQAIIANVVGKRVFGGGK